MTSHLLRHGTSQQSSNDATDIYRNEVAPCDYDRGYQEGASNTTAALFAGLLIGAGSTALAIWLAQLIL